MAAIAYILIETGMGKTRSVAEALRGLTSDHSRVLNADTVTGPYDVIAVLESDNGDLDSFGTFINTIQEIEGVSRTQTCLCIKLG